MISRCDNVESGNRLASCSPGVDCATSALRFFVFRNGRVSKFTALENYLWAFDS